MRRMLINGKNREEVRVAIVDGVHLEGYQVALAEGGLSRGNVFRGIVANMVPTLNAAFIEFGEAKQGFLAFHDVVPQAFHRKGVANWHPHRIDEILERGRPVLVQVTKDAAGGKGAALTTNISLAGRYLVFTPFEAMVGVSRKVEDEDERRKLKAQVEALAVPAGAGVIVRTAALDQSKTALTRDLAALERLWKRIREESGKGAGPRLLYSDQDLVVQALRDHLDTSMGEVLVDDEAAFEQAQAYMRAFMPRAKTRLVRYDDRMPLFSRYDLEAQIDAITQRTVALPGGGTLVIDRTEALTAIDVNSARAKGGGSQDELIVKVNLEAAREVARQLRLRDIGGLVVVDFIDMRSQKHQREVERTVKEAMKGDKARSTVGKISPNGLLEINRQRLKQSLEVRTRRVCPTCAGLGTLSSPELVALRLLRRIQTEAASGGLKAVRIDLHPELADAFQNARRQDIAALERDFDIRVEVVAATSLHRSEERIEWTRREAGDVRLAPVAAVTAADAANAFVERPRGGGRTAIERDGETDAGAEADEAGGKRRRRKRSGRRHKKGAGEVPASAEASGGETPAGEPLAEAPGPLGEDADEGGPKRKRRRGGRKHRKGGVDEAPKAGQDATDAPGGGEPPAATVEVGAAAVEADPTPGGDGAGKRRRRRRGGKRHRKLAEGAQPTPGAAEGRPAELAQAPPPAEAGGETPPARARRPRKRKAPVAQA